MPATTFIEVLAERLGVGLQLRSRPVRLRRASPRCLRCSLRIDLFSASLTQRPECSPVQGEARSSTLLRGANLRGNSSAGRAPPCHGGGREFKPRFPLQRFNTAVTHRTRVLRYERRSSRFNSCRPYQFCIKRGVAQLVEQWILIPPAEGSSPSAPAISVPENAAHGSSSVGRAAASKSACPGFDSSLPCTAFSVSLSGCGRVV